MDEAIAADADGLPTRPNPEASTGAVRANAGRNARGRRRLADPTTCERDYSGARREFLSAIRAYQGSGCRMYPTWSEVLEIAVGLGYRRSPA